MIRKRKTTQKKFSLMNEQSLMLSQDAEELIMSELKDWTLSEQDSNLILVKSKRLLLISCLLKSYVLLLTLSALP